MISFHHHLPFKVVDSVRQSTFCEFHDAMVVFRIDVIVASYSALIAKARHELDVRIALDISIAEMEFVSALFAYVHSIRVEVVNQLSSQIP